MAAPRTLVALHSLANNTRKTAQARAERIGADLNEIIPSQAPRSVFLAGILGTFDSMRAREWPTRPSEHPVADYVLVIVGSPIWVAP